MSNGSPLILQVHVPGAALYELGDEIWQQSLSDAIRAEAEIIAGYAGPGTLRIADEVTREALRDRLTVAFRQVGDTYAAPDGVAYTLTNQTQLDLAAHEDTLVPMAPAESNPIIEQVLCFKDLPLGSSGTRCAVVRWSDGTESRALTWYCDEILICEGDLLGKTRAQLRTLHYQRDRDWLQS